MADDKPTRARRGADAAQERTTEVGVQAAPDVPDDAADKSVQVPGEGHVSRAEGVQAAQAGNEQVAERFQVEQSQGYWGDNPTAEVVNQAATAEAQMEFLQLSKEEQDARRRELHDDAKARASADDWS